MADNTGDQDPAMTPQFFADLRAANIARQVEWQGAADICLDFRLVELGGEVGEALNIAKKLERERLGLVGSRATPAQLGEELADIVICADLVAWACAAAALDIEDGDAREAAANPKTAPITCARLLLGALGDLEYLVDYHGPELAEQARDRLENLIWTVAVLAYTHGLDLAGAVTAKFNATSAKVGLSTRMGAGV